MKKLLFIVLFISLLIFLANDVFSEYDTDTPLSDRLIIKFANPDAVIRQPLYQGPNMYIGVSIPAIDSLNLRLIRELCG
jgi:hypothetical protein